MRSLFLVLLLANLLLFAIQFDAVHDLLLGARAPVPQQIAADKLRIVRSPEVRRP